MLGIIKGNFICLTEKAFVTLCKSLVRCHLEYANSVWNPYKQGLINDLEKVTLYWRTRGDMIEVYKILTN